MKKSLIVLLLVIFAQAAPGLAAENAFAFQGAGCGQDCASCHTLSKDEAKKLIKADVFKAEIGNIKMSPIKGLWEIEGTTKEGKIFIVYVDFAKKYLVEGRFTPLEQLGKPPEMKKVDLAGIPLADAIVMGNPMAKTRIIVFDDPDCPFCKRLHEEIKKLLNERKDIAFYIKLYPLDIHPDAYEKSKAIVCKKSVQLLDDAFAGKKLPKPDCKAREVDENIKLGKSLGITGTPTLIFPDGRMLPGFVDGPTLLKMLGIK
ncbi:MAG: DsbC family protein [Deltaproteobacteria bacterium]|nr:DsbC family protein [Deltaproteobacteria bacterium]